MVEPFAHLPDEAMLSRQEVALVLEAIELGLAATPPGRARINVRNAKVLLIAKLWPELGMLIQDPEEEDR